MAAFVPPSSAPDSSKELWDKLDRLIVRRFASGNTRIQHGQFSTKEDIDREYNVIEKHHFN